MSKRKGEEEEPITVEQAGAGMSAALSVLERCAAALGVEPAVLPPSYEAAVARALGGVFKRSTPDESPALVDPLLAFDALCAWPGAADGAGAGAGAADGAGSGADAAGAACVSRAAWVALAPRMGLADDLTAGWLFDTLTGIDGEEDDEPAGGSAAAAAAAATLSSEAFFAYLEKLRAKAAFSAVEAEAAQLLEAAGGAEHERLIYAAGDPRTYICQHVGRRDLGMLALTDHAIYWRKKGLFGGNTMERFSLLPSAEDPDRRDLVSRWVATAAKSGPLGIAAFDNAISLTKQDVEREISQDEADTQAAIDAATKEGFVQKEQKLMSSSAKPLRSKFSGSKGVTIEAPTEQRRSLHVKLGNGKRDEHVFNFPGRDFEISTSRRDIWLSAIQEVVACGELMLTHQITQPAAIAQLHEYLHASFLRMRAAKGVAGSSLLQSKRPIVLPMSRAVSSPHLGLALARRVCGEQEAEESLLEIVRERDEEAAAVAAAAHSREEALESARAEHLGSLIALNKLLVATLPMHTAYKGVMAWRTPPVTAGCMVLCLSLAWNCRLLLALPLALLALAAYTALSGRSTEAVKFVYKERSVKAKLKLAGQLKEGLENKFLRPGSQNLLKLHALQAHTSPEASASFAKGLAYTAALLIATMLLVPRSVVEIGVVLKLFTRGMPPNLKELLRFRAKEKDDSDLRRTPARLRRRGSVDGAATGAGERKGAAETLAILREDVSLWWSLVPAVGIERSEHELTFEEALVGGSDDEENQ